jgi:hypothetical protein
MKLESEKVKASMTNIINYSLCTERAANMLKVQRKERASQN